MLQPYSQAERAYRDTLIRKSDGSAFDAIARYYGFPRLATIDRKYWRQALLHLAYGCRGTLGTTFAVLEAIFDHYAVPRMTHAVQLDPAQPRSLLHLDAFAVGGAPGWDCGHTGRLIRMVDGPFAGRVYYSEDLVAVPLPPVLRLADVQTTYWSAADWSDLDAVTTVKVKVIPFMIREPSPGPPWLDGDDSQGDPWHPLSWHPQLSALFEITLDGFLWPVPATYLQADGSVDRTVAAPGQPYGGHMMSLAEAANDPAIPEAGDPLGAGPHPIYLSSLGAGAKAVSDLINGILAAGVRVKSPILEWCPGTSVNVFDPIFDLEAATGGAVSAARQQSLPLDVEGAWDFFIHGVPHFEGDGT